MTYYPELGLTEDIQSENLAIQTYGKRIYEGQTLYEYLLEFLLIAYADKELNGEEKSLGFPNPPKLTEKSDKLTYKVYPRMGLKRFIFFDKSKLENRFDIDEEAYQNIVNEVKNHIDVQMSDITKDDIVDILQDLFYSFSAVLRNRAWFVQSLLPICPELIFCESMGKKKKRENKEYQEDDKFLDYGFDFKGYSFMARGGEVYFLHLLQGLSSDPSLKDGLEKGLNRLVSSYPVFSELANWVQNIWENKVNFEHKTIEKKCEWIPSGYQRRALLTCKELHNFLLTNMNTFQAMEILAHGIVLQILRMMHEQALLICKPNKQDIPVWIMDISRQDKNIRKESVGSYKLCEEELTKALHKFLINRDKINEKLKKKYSDIKLLNEATKNSHKLFRRLGKEIGLVIPFKGPLMRFTLSENLLKFLVVSLIPPRQKLTFTSFIQKLYEHYRMIIGPYEFLKHIGSTSKKDKFAYDYSYFDGNLIAFQEMLKQCGFLRDLSDATAIVENPYEGID